MGMQMGSALELAEFAARSRSAESRAPNSIIRMEASNIPAFQKEDFMPPEDELKARVDFVYERNDNSSMDVQPSTGRAFGKELNGQLESFVGKRKAMEDAVAQIVSPNDPQDVKLRKIYDRVQQIRNTSYELRKTEQEAEARKGKSSRECRGGLEARLRQRCATDVALSRSGAGRGLRSLRVLGFGPSTLFFSTRYDGKSKLDANVVLVKLNGKDLYFDPGRRSHLSGC